MILVSRSVTLGIESKSWRIEEGQDTRRSRVHIQDNAQDQSNLISHVGPLSVGVISLMEKTHFYYYYEGKNLGVEDGY
jgi:hypothetical protein